MSEERTNTREQEIEYLVEEIGVERRQAEIIMEDDDLWLVDPEARYGFEGEEAVWQWKEAYKFARALNDGFVAHGRPVVNHATQQLLHDARERAEEALRRARERV
jgi:hypothetical protein